MSESKYVGDVDSFSSYIDKPRENMDVQFSVPLKVGVAASLVRGIRNKPIESDNFVDRFKSRNPGAKMSCIYLHSGKWVSSWCGAYFGSRDGVEICLNPFSAFDFGFDLFSGQMKTRPKLNKRLFNFMYI